VFRGEVGADQERVVRRVRSRAGRRRIVRRGTGRAAA
jgi:hypothetical protein